MDFSGHWAGLCALIIFGVAYVLVILEEITGMAKSKPVLMFAVLTMVPVMRQGHWLLITLTYGGHLSWNAALV